MNDEKQTINEEVAAEAKKQLPLAVRLGIPAVLIIIVLGLVFGKSMLSPNDPAKLLSLAVLNSKDVTETDASFKMTMEMITDGEDPQEQEIAELINHISAEGFVKMNAKSVEDFKMLEQLKYNYDDIELATANIYLDADTIAIQVPTFLNEWVYADFDKLVKIIGEYSGTELDFSIKDYYELFTTDDIKDFDAIALEYGKYLLEQIEGNLTLAEEKATVKTTGNNSKEYECKQVVLNITMEEYYKIYFNFIDKLVNDERMKEIVKTKLDKAIEISKANGVLELTGATAADLEAYNTDFDKTYEEGIVAFNKEINADTLAEVLNESGMENSNMVITFLIDSKNNIRGLKEDMVMSTIADEKLITMKINVDMVYNSFENVIIPSPDFENGYDMTENPETKAMTIMFEVQSKLQNYLEERPQLQKIMEQLSGY